MKYESSMRIKKLLNSADRKIGVKNINLLSAIKILSNGYTGATASEYFPTSTENEDVVFKGLSSIKAGLNISNAKTGYNDFSLTEAMQRLCNGYTEGVPLYSFGALADIHIQYATGLDDFARALSYLKDRVLFTCVCGDLVSYASSENMAQYKAYINAYAGNMPIYECAGNHETFPSLGVSGTLDTDLWISNTGKDVYYSFEYGKDVFIFLSIYRHTPNNLFPSGGLEWLESILEANKNKRCFVFQHIPQSSIDKAADPSNSYDSGMLEGTDGKAFVALLKSYKNTVWFHGHTHFTLGLDEYPVSDECGYRSVHIPSLVAPRFYNKEANSYADSYIDENGNTVQGAILAEGYIVDVYENKIVLRSINFASGANKDEVTPFTDEIYAVDTTLQTL